MKQEKSDPALHYFDSATTETERATFEAGTALSTLYHSLIGFPVRADRKQIAALQQAMARLVENQPYKEKVKVRIHQEKLRVGTGEYEYSEISVESLQLEVTARLDSGREDGVRRRPELPADLSGQNRTRISEVLVRSKKGLQSLIEPRRVAS